METSNLWAILLASITSVLNPNANVSQITSYELPAIAGLWEVDLGDNNQCKERYNFGNDGYLTTTSGAEQTSGKYRLAYVEEVDLPVLAIKTEQDNNEKDCSGAQIDQTGDTFVMFVRLDGRHNPQKMQWCADQTLESCTTTFYRILP